MLLKKLMSLRGLKRIYIERLGEPIIYNIVSLFVLMFGNIVSKINYDLVPRQPYAFGLNEAFNFSKKNSKKLGIKRLYIIEFGVASGAGLLNLCSISKKLEKHYNLPCKIVGFDSGEGMPAAIDYRDHPEKYKRGDFIPHNSDRLLEALPDNANIYYGLISETLQKLSEEMEEGDFVAFVSIDVDYYSSSLDCFKLFSSKDISKLPRMPIYLDDVNNIDHNEFCGELLAVSEFNQSNKHTKMAKMNQLRSWRIFKNALYLDQMYWWYDFTSEFYTEDYHKDGKTIQLSNPYLNMKLVD